MAPFTLSAPPSADRQPCHWQSSLRSAVRDPIELCRLLELEPDSILSHQAHRRFPLLVPREFLQKIEPRNPRDPLLLQVLPQPDEDDQPSGFVRDPVGDEAAQQAPGYLQKYAGRVLIMPTMSCAVHCRYCFRRNYLDPAFFRLASPASTPPIRTNRPPIGNDDRLDRICRLLSEDDSIREVIFSGGDPLMLPDEQLARWTRRLERVPHLTTLRIHTRLPVMIPSRIDKGLLESLTETRLHVVVVLHVNHPREIDHDLADGTRRLQRSGAVVLNQSVLLRHVNDRADTLIELSQRLLEGGILPYYLHQLDPVEGAAHFRVSDKRGRALITQMRNRLPGYLVPRLVRELPGKPHKIPLS